MCKMFGIRFPPAFEGNLPECICFSERLLDYTSVQRLNLYFTLHHIILVTRLSQINFTGLPDSVPSHMCSQDSKETVLHLCG